MTAVEKAAEDRQSLVDLLNDQGCDPLGGLHGWRCGYPDRYGPCECVAQLAAAIEASDWLAARNREMAVHAWDRGWNSSVMWHEGERLDVPANPYREATDG